ncbi:MAG: MarR family transcriptional regulator [Tetrasphaera sp.]
MHSVSRPPGVAFLLAQIGTEVSRRFGERLLPLGITAADAACLRIVATAGPLNQRRLAHRLGIVPSRVVSLVDSLERRGLVERRVARADRRSREVTLTGAGGELFGQLRTVAQAHQEEIAAGLDADEVAQLAGLLRRVAAARGLSPDSQPGPGA